MSGFPLVASSTAVNSQDTTGVTGGGDIACGGSTILEPVLIMERGIVKTGILANYPILRLETLVTLESPTRQRPIPSKPLVESKKNNTFVWSSYRDRCEDCNRASLLAEVPSECPRIVLDIEAATFAF
ncbi:hypothetical protein EDD85DRAFT_796161 [Armillaria nabsnona]|nr:hypothetical protein EDD85DRAFT_796161 [Armillaria nabsnona]